MALINVSSSFLYSISHPGRNGMPQVDLSDDEEALVTDESLTDRQKAVESVIKKAFSKYK